MEKAPKIAPWLGLAAAVWVQIAAGNSYTFPLYSHRLKTLLQYSQQQLNNLGVGNDIGDSVGLLAGLLCNKIPPWAILLIGSASSFFGYGLIWLVLSERISPLPYWVIWIALCIGANSSTWFNTAVLVTNMRNFPQSRGTVAGILKGIVGLSGAVFTEVFSGFLRKNSINLLFFLAVGPSVVSLLMMHFIRPCKPASGEDMEEHKYFVFFQVTSIILAVYLFLTSMANYFFSLDRHSTSNLIVVLLMLLLLLAPLMIPLKMALHAHMSSELHIDPIRQPLIAEEEVSGFKSIANEKSPGSPCNNTPVSDMSKETGSEVGELENLLSFSSSTSICLYKNGTISEIEDTNMEILLAEGEGAVRKKRRPRRGEDFNLRQALVKADFWLLFATFFCGVGSGVTVLNNLAQIGLAEGFQDVTLLLSLISVCNFLGRLGGGVLSEHYVRDKAIPRSVWMAVTQIIMVGVFLFFASALPGSLHISSALLGICYGVQFSVMVPMASELFGLKHFGMIYNFLTMGNPLGAFLLSGLLTGYLYDKEAKRQAGYFHPGLLDATDVECLGPNCFRLSFLIMGGVCAIGALLSIILTLRTRPVYETLYRGGSFSIQRKTDDTQNS